jgi:hypothetical protein
VNLCVIDIVKKALIINVKGDISDIREAVVGMLKDNAVLVAKD